ncbi:MAG: glucose PTS transporter subunit IIA, partial [Staphylococcus equorum]|nr:glucose PTS transporter subunit IIA [Staphylococcus equorum]
YFKTIIDKDSFDQKTVKENEQNPISKFVGFLGGIFVPILPALIAGGMIKSITTLVEMAGWVDATTDIGILLNILGDSVFYFLPFFLAISTARILKTNEYLATMVAAVILYPTLTNGLESGATTLNILGVSIPVISYATTVFPIIFGVILLKYVYQFFEKIIHENIRMIFSPLLTIIIIGFLSLAFLAPIGHYLGEYLAQGITVIFDWNGVLASIIIGGFLPLIVMLGMHQSLFPLMLNNLAENGFDTLLPLFYLQTLAIAGAAFAVFFVAKNKDIKSSSISTGITSFLGISEPALYGVSIPLKKPLIAALIGSGVAGGLSYFLGVRAFAFGLPSVLSIPTYINAAEGSSLSAVLISSVVSFGLAFVLSYILMKRDKEPAAIMEEQTVDQTITTNPSSPSMNIREDIYSPVDSGKVLELSEIEDEVFSHQLLGPSVAIKPMNRNIYAPINGEITMISETEHALGITSDKGLELLIHIGIDTVKLGGEPFTMHVKVGDKVQQGNIIAEVDLDYLRDKQLNNVILLAVTNDDEVKITAKENESVTRKSLILEK